MLLTQFEDLSRRTGDYIGDISASIGDENLQPTGGGRGLFSVQINARCIIDRIGLFCASCSTIVYHSAMVARMIKISTTADIGAILRYLRKETGFTQRNAADCATLAFLS